MPLPIDLSDIERAAGRLKGVAHRTPVLTSRTVDAACGARVVLKAEGFQRVGAFKFRGAYNAVSQLEPGTAVVASSSGNHAQALALAAGIARCSATIYMPTDAPASKRAATEGYGATIVEYDRYRDDRDALTAAHAREHGAVEVHPYDEPQVMAGAGTVGLELLQDEPELDTVAIPLGGGGLLSGCLTAIKAVSPSTRVIGVEPVASPDYARSLEAGERLSVDIAPSICDGQLLPSPGARPWQVVEALADGVVTVTDDEVRDAMRLLFERCKVVAEPSGASALAAVLAGRVAGERIGVVLSGANVDAQRFAELLG